LLKTEEKYEMFRLFSEKNNKIFIYYSKNGFKIMKSFKYNLKLLALKEIHLNYEIISNQIIITRVVENISVYLHPIVSHIPSHNNFPQKKCENM